MTEAHIEDDVIGRVRNTRLSKSQPLKVKNETFDLTFIYMHAGSDPSHRLVLCADGDRHSVRSTRRDHRVRYRECLRHRDGRMLLIPQGSRLIGQYDSQVAYGQRRVLVVWTRLIMPDGSSIVLDRLPGADTQGNGGLEDRVNWHWGRLFAGAAVSTLLGVNAELVTGNAAANSGSVVIATRQSAQDTVNQVGQELTRRNLDIQPTLTERPGLPLRVVINRDLVLKPYGS